MELGVSSKAQKAACGQTHFGPSHTLVQDLQILFPCSRLRALIFPKVSSCGPCARLSGELWRSWRRFACWGGGAVNICFSVAQQPAFPLYPLPSKCISPHPPLLFSKRIPGRNWTLDPALLLPCHCLHVTRLLVSLSFPDFSKSLSFKSIFWVSAM